MSKDKIIQSVINKIKDRSKVGFKKYGVTLYDDNQPLDKWLNHIQEELISAYPEPEYWTTNYSNEIQKE